MKTSRFVAGVLTMTAVAMVDVSSADDMPTEGYLLDSQRTVVRSGFGLCWHTGFWTPDMATEGCGLTKVAEAVAPVAVPERPASVVIALQSDTLFAFDTSVIRDEGKQELDSDVIGKMKVYAQIERVLVTGHADRIGADAYNMQLSQRRADAVKGYLIEQGIDAARVETAAKGEAEPVVACDEVQGGSSGGNRELVECLKPNRRVMVEITAQQPVVR